MVQQVCALSWGMRYFIISLILLCTCEQVTSQIVKPNANRNLIANGDFRSRDPEQRPLRWFTGRGLQTAYVSTEQHHAPEKDDVACKLTDTAATDSVVIRSEKRIASAGSKYLAAAFVKYSKGVPASLSVEFWNQHGKRITVQSVTAAADTGWKNISLTATAPDSVTHLTLTIATTKEGTGISFWDDISLVQELTYDAALATGVRELFIDDYRIEALEDVQRVIHPAQKIKPVIVPTEPWEGNSTYIYGTVLKDQPKGSGYRMWYTCYLKEKYYLCYATSKDGISWTKPKLGVVEMNGSKANNICREGGGTVVYDPYDADTTRRYKLMRFDGSKEKFGYGVHFSHDGWHWNEYASNPVLPYGDVSNVMYDTAKKLFIATTKQRMLISNTSVTPSKMDRIAFVSVSKDFVHWFAPASTTSAWTLAVEGDYIDDQMVRARGGIEAQIYGMPIYPYEQQYIGLPWVFDIKSYNTGEFAVTGDGPIQPQLAVSRDLINWSRPLREPIIPLGKAGSWDDGTIYTATTLQVSDKEISVYYGGMNLPHGGNTSTQLQFARIGRASWRRDGFVSMYNAGDDAGKLITKPVTASGSALYVNAQLEAGGYIEVEVRDANNKVLATSKRLVGDQLTGKLVDVKAFAGQTVQLVFKLKGGHLYSFWFAK